MWKNIKRSEFGHETWIFEGLKNYTLNLNVYRYGKPTRGIPGYPLLPKSKWTYQIVLYKDGRGYGSVSVTPQVKWNPKIKNVLRSFMKDHNTPADIKKYYKENLK